MAVLINLRIFGGKLLAGLLLPIPFLLLGVLIGIIQAYIFTVLAAVHRSQLHGEMVAMGTLTQLMLEEDLGEAGEVARLFADAGVIAIVPLISPYRADRALVRDVVERVVESGHCELTVLGDQRAPREVGQEAAARGGEPHRQECACDQRQLGQRARFRRVPEAGRQ